MNNNPINADRCNIGCMTTFAKLAQMVMSLRPHATNFNHLSVNEANMEHESEVILQTLKSIETVLVSYGEWRKDSLTKLSNPTDAQNQMETMLKLASAMDQPPVPRVGIDPRKLLRLDMMQNEIIPRMGSIWFTIYANNKCDSTPMLQICETLLSRVIRNLHEVLSGACAVYNIQLSVLPGIEEIDVVKPHEFIPSDYKLVFEHHDEIVAFSDDEIAEQRRLEQIEAEKARKAAELEQAKKAMKDDATCILNAYNKLISSGNIKLFKLTDDVLKKLENPACEEDLDICRSLFRFLMAMSNTNRYMPGEEGTVNDRVMGSFMELEKDVLAYSSQFMVYLGEYDLDHNDVVTVLETFDSSNGKIVAQYIDTKEYLDSIVSNPKRIKTINIFVMK